MQKIFLIFLFMLTTNSHAAEIHFLGTLNGATGATLLENPNATTPYHSLIFENNGTSKIVISHITINHPDNIVSIGPEVYEIEPGVSNHLRFAAQDEFIVSIEFLVKGQTETIDVYGVTK